MAAFALDETRGTMRGTNMSRRSTTLAIGLLMLHAACGGAQDVHASRPTAKASASHPPEDAKLDSVARVHGGAGPWAVAGYRMGEYALGVLGLEQGSFDLEVVHFTPREVQYACIADGAAAATGASVGKLNLTLADAPRADTRTTYRRKSTGKAVTLQPTASFAERFTNVRREQLAAAGRIVLSLRDDEIFEVVPP